MSATRRPNDDPFLLEINQHIGIVHRVCNVYFWDDPAEREDVFQEVLYQLYKSYDQFGGKSKFSTWMYRVALNTAITHFRKRKRKPPTEQLLPSHDAPVERDERDERIQQMYAAIETLSRLDKAIVLLYLDDLSYDEIADVTNLSKVNVGVRLVRIRKMLEQK
ncbi:MAG: sigma-70 family RNA polymerase sigma factor [Bacteroidia bacterium]|nr:sigma-70 family RNA polymerase sigma factor [Bacteroidia bacterium]